MYDNDLTFYLLIFGLPLVFLFLQVRPKILQYDNITVVTSGFRAELFCLWFAGRRVVIDPNERTVKFNYRWFWFITSERRIEFDWVQQVNFGGNFLWCMGNVQNPLRERRSFMDVYSIQLQLKNGEVVTVVRFVGEDISEGGPLMLADILSGSIGVPIGAPTE